MSHRSRRVVVVVACALGACRPSPSSSPPRARPVVVVPSDAAPAAVAATGAVVRPGRPRGLIEAPHAGPIAIVAATVDGTAAISSDDLGGIRLWPTLDGTVEPRVVDLPRPRALALAATAHGFLVAAIDEVGGLLLQQIDRDGVTLQRATLPPDPAFLGIAMSVEGPIGWRADHVLVRLDADGTVLGELPAEAGQHLVALATSGARTIAVVDAPAGRRARWLAMTPTPAWGAWLDAGPALSSVIALSPSGKRLAYVVSGSQSQIVAVATDTRAILAVRPVPHGVSIGFIDDDHVATVSGSNVGWVDLGAKALMAQPVADGGNELANSLVAIGGGRAIAAAHGELVIATPASLEYLGYELPAPTVAAAGAGGELVVGAREALVRLGPDLRSIGTPELGIPSGAALATLDWVGGDQWLVQHAGIADGRAALVLARLGAPPGPGSGPTTAAPSRVVRAGLAAAHVIHHEPSTQLVTLSFGTAPEIARYEPAHRQLTSVTRPPKPRGHHQLELVPVAPKLANGTQVVVVEARDRLTVRWAQDPARLERGPSITLDGAFAAADRAGHVYAWTSTDQGLELGVYRDGKRIGALPRIGSVRVWPDRDGTRVATVGADQVSVYAVDGTLLWTHAMHLVSEVIWLDDRQLAVVTSTGIARLDAATGAVQVARCGWRFGRSRAPHAVLSSVEPLCVQLR